MSARKPDGVDLMNRELNAGAEYVKQLRRHNMTPVVDDDYPQIRFEYDQAVRSLIAAFRANGRIP